MARRLGVALGACALATAACAASAANIPDPVKKLTGSSDDTARSVMAQQGYLLRNQKTSWGRDYSYWWNDKSRQCVQLMSLVGRVAQVQVKGESDCKPGTITAPAAPVAALDPLTLAGQPRGAADQRLIRAGFTVIANAFGTDETAYITWTDGRQCLGVRVVSDRYERVDELDKAACYIK